MVTIKELEDRMRPGNFSVMGFLGQHEKLTAVLEQDDMLLAKLQFSHNELAEPLLRLIDMAVDSKKKYIVSGPFEVRIETFKGFQVCPWAENPHEEQCTMGKGVQHASVNWSITNKNKKMQLKGPGLIIHLIRDHHFFEGLQSPCRVDPLQLAELLGLLD